MTTRLAPLPLEMTMLLGIRLVTLVMSILQRHLLVTTDAHLLQAQGNIGTTLRHHLEVATMMIIAEGLHLLFMTEIGTLHHHQRLTMPEGAMGLLRLLLTHIADTLLVLRLSLGLTTDTIGDQLRGIPLPATLLHHHHPVVEGLRRSETTIDHPPRGTILTIAADLLRLLVILLVISLVLAQSLLLVVIGAALSARFQQGLLLPMTLTMVMDILETCKALRVETILELCRRILDLVATWNLLRTDALESCFEAFLLY